MFKIYNSYLSLPKEFYQKVNPSAAKSPELVIMNEELSSYLDIRTDDKQKFLNTFSGKVIFPNSVPLALVYAGHQFGHFVPQLGDGRAVLLGELFSKDNRLFDIQLKGSGTTKFSRNGDGKCPLGPALREYIISESLFFLNVPTTRSLAVILTGEDVFREKRFPGAILVRIASSHIRVGTFEYFYAKKDQKNLKNLVNFSISKHFSEISKLPNEEKYLEFFKLVMSRHISLVSKWLSYGFIHGVMNTDNTSISGETIDYGPCAFMDHFSKNRVFSSIDYQGRYSFFNQPKILLWNLTSLANCLSLILSTKNIKKLKDVLSEFSEQFNLKLLETFSNKLGIFKKNLHNEKLIREWLEILEIYNLDFTNSFLKLSKSLTSTTFFDNFPKSELTQSFYKTWSELLNKQGLKIDDFYRKLNQVNPQYIPRNHLVDEAINKSLEGDYEKLIKLNTILKEPFKYKKTNEDYQKIPKEDSGAYKTFCGT